tara:strand:- start:562 stop:1131 length:570 start_codon:yes stop_codon:yes gene_type:complete
MKKNIIFCILMFGTTITNLAQNTVYDMQNSALLIRLQSNEHLINYYLDNGDTLSAYQTQKKQTDLNNKIIQDFKNEWSLCPVYFFLAQYSKEILANNFSNVFLNSNRDKIPQKDLDKIKRHFFTAYMGKNPGKMKFNALVLCDHNLIQLEKPNPRYVRTYKGMGFLKRELKKSIRILQKKLEFRISRKQ